jgi:hypothetical protein
MASPGTSGDKHRFISLMAAINGGSAFFVLVTYFREPNRQLPASDNNTNTYYSKQCYGQRKFPF